MVDRTAYVVDNIMTDPEVESSAKPICELVANPDFPNSAIGQKVDINGFTGVIAEVVRNSIKVRSAEGHTLSYNCHALRKLYGPRPAAPEPPSEPPARERVSLGAPPARPEPKREIITAPSFQSPPVSIEALVQRPDFPRCAFGTFIDLHGFTGVVVELVGGSLRVQSPDGIIRRYNAEGLRKIYGRSSPI